MSIENCPECRMQISSYAEICPYCGCKVDFEEGRGSYSVSIVSIPNFEYSFPLISEFFTKATGLRWGNILIDELKHLPFEIACELNLRNMKLVKKDLEEMGCVVSSAENRFPIGGPNKITNEKAYSYYDEKKNAPHCCPRCKSTDLFSRRTLMNHDRPQWINECCNCKYKWLSK